MGTISLFAAAEMRTAWHLNLERLGPPWEAGYVLGRKWWNKGYATEALCAVRDYWFGTVGGLWLAACHANENIASSAVLQKVGFVYDHDATYRRFDGTPMPCRAFAVTLNLSRLRWNPLWPHSFASRRIRSASPMARRRPST